MTFRALLMLLGIGVALACDRPNLDATTPTSLIGDLQSKASPEGVQSILGSKASGWQVVFTEQITPAALERPVEVIRVEIPEYEHLGFVGRLLLTFNDNLLTRTEFCPTDFDAYVEDLEGATGIPIREVGSGGYENGDTVIWAWTYEPGNECVGWRDQQLTRVFRDSD